MDRELGSGTKWRRLAGRLGTGGVALASLVVLWVWL